MLQRKHLVRPLGLLARHSDALDTPALEGAPEVGGVVVAKESGDLIDGEFFSCEVLFSDLVANFVKDLAIGRAFPRRDAGAGYVGSY